MVNHPPSTHHRLCIPHVPFLQQPKIFSSTFSDDFSHRLRNSQQPSAVPPNKRKAPASPVYDSAPQPKKLVSAMASDASDEDIFDYDDEEVSDMDYDDGDSSIDEGYYPPYPKEFDVDVVVDIDMDQDLGLSLVLEEKNARRA